MKIARSCALFLLIVFPVTTALAQRGEPSWVNPLPDTVHERVSHHTYHSAVMDVDVGYGIYLPPGYEDPSNQDRRYPVVYFLHGGFGNEARMLDPADVDMASLIDARIQSGDVGSMIYVFPNGGAPAHYDYGDSLAETTFVEELIPLIDTKYRTISSRAGRGIEGFSSGGRGAARDMFRHPELFCSAVPLAGGHQQEKRASENGGRLGGPAAGIVLDPGYNSWDLAEEYAASDSNPRLEILVVVGADGMNYQANLEWMGHLESLEIPFERRIIPDVGHDPEMIYEKAGDEIMSFHESCFQMAGE